MPDFTFPNCQAIVQEAQTIIGEVAGPGVQIYSEDQTYAALQRAFELVFIKRPWEQYCRWAQYTLDGVTGKVTDPDPFGDVVSPDLSDFIYVGRADEQRPLPLLNNRINPLTLTGTYPRAWTSLPVSDPDFLKKRIMIYPQASITPINVKVRIRPQTFHDVDVIYMDRMLMVFGTAWQVLDFDGTNAGAADTVKQLFDLRYRDIEHTLADQPLEIATGYGIPNEWFVNPY